MSTAVTDTIEIAKGEACSANTGFSCYSVYSSDHSFLLLLTMVMVVLDVLRKNKYKQLYYTEFLNLVKSD